MTFEFAPGLQAGLPLGAGLLLFSGVRLARQGVSGWRLLAILVPRGLVLGMLALLAARPVWTDARELPPGGRPIVVLLDRSESMSVEESGRSRQRRALEFATGELFPALAARGIPVRTMAFAEHTEEAGAAGLAGLRPDGKRTNLGGAISRAAQGAEGPPLAVIALTDGAANETADNSRALAGLLDGGTPFFGVGFGSDTAAPTLTLRQVDAPAAVAPRSSFAVSAMLELVNIEAETPFELVLFRNDQMVQRRTIQTRRGSRSWVETFRVSEERKGAVAYTVQLLPPALPDLKSGATRASAAVRVSDEQGMRLLYVQGALTWDYKFISLALREDAAARITGLTRTSAQSVFRQNVESSGELLKGFPTTLDELAPFRVVVLSNLRPADLSPPQQELLARFCGELGGGILMVGGMETFDASWQGSRLEQLLPVVFAPNRGVQGLERPFRLRLTEEAMQHEAFQIADDAPAREVWGRLPTFTRYGIVDAAKPAAQIWAVHASEKGPQGPRILLASQRYGAGLSAVCCVQNFWRWRLAREADTRQFDRFWRQFFRFLGESSRQEISLALADQDIRIGSELEVVVERQPAPQSTSELPTQHRVRVEDPNRKIVLDETVELAPRRPISLKFPTAAAGNYTVTALDAAGVVVAARSVEVRDVNVELMLTARNMELLRQWATVSGGNAIKAEDCQDAGALVDSAVRSAESIRRRQSVRRPLGANGWVLTALLAGLGIEWALRRRWQLA